MLPFYIFLLQKRRPGEAIKKKKELEIQLADASAVSDPTLGCF